MHPPLRQQISDIVTSLLSAPNLSANMTSNSITDLKAFVRVSRVLFRPFTWRAELLNPEISGRQYDQRRKLQEALDQEEWYATVEDVKRVWTNAIRHRVRVKDKRDSILFAVQEEACVKAITAGSQSPEIIPVGPVDAILRQVPGPKEEDEALARILDGILGRCI